MSQADGESLQAAVVSAYEILYVASSSCAGRHSHIASRNITVKIEIAATGAGNLDVR